MPQLDQQRTRRSFGFDVLEERLVMSASPLDGSELSHEEWSALEFSIGELTLEPQDVTAGVDQQIPQDDPEASLAQIGSLIGLNQVFQDYTYRGTGYSVVVIDTGVDYNHAALGGGWGNRVIAGWDFVDDDPDPMDQNGHGTHVAGIIASGDATYRGMAPEVNIIALRVLGANGSGNFGDVEAALQWVRDHQAQYNIVAVNLSLGEGNYASNPYAYLDDEFSQLVSQGVFIAAASGNSFYGYSSQPGLGFPAISGYTVSVGAVWDANVGPASWASGARDYSTAPDRITSFTQRSSRLDILAPGAFVYAPYLGGGFASLGGTSMAAPVIAGAAALMHQALDDSGQGSLANQNYILNVMRNTGVTVIDGDDENDNVTNTGLSFQRIDLLAAMRFILGGDNQQPALAAISDQNMALGQPTLVINLAGSDLDGDPLNYGAIVQSDHVGGDIPATVQVAGNVLTVTPLAGFSGSFLVTASVTDGTATVYRTFRVSVAGQNGSIPFVDNFNRADGVFLSNTWIEQQGNFQLSGSRATSSPTHASIAVVNGINIADVAVSADIQASGSDGGVGLLARQNGSQNQNFYYGGVINRGGVYSAEIYRVVNGVWTLLGSTSLPSGSGNLRFLVAGSVLEIHFNSQLALRVTDSAITGPGRIGIQGRIGSLDNFQAQTATVPALTSLPFVDAFGRPDGNNIGPLWTEQQGDFYLTGQTLVASATQNSLATVNDVEVADVILSANVYAAGNDGGIGFVARQSGAGLQNYYFGSLTNRNGNYSAEIYRVVNGVFTLLVSQRVNSASGVLRFEVVGDSLQLFFNGQGVASATDGAITSSGRIGVRGRIGMLDNISAQIAAPTTVNLPYVDTFNRTDSTVLGAEWTERAGDFRVAGNWAVSSPSTASIATLNGVNATDVSLSADMFAAGLDGGVGLIARQSVTGGQTFYYGGLINRAGQISAELYRVVNGGWVLLRSQAVGSASGNLALVIQGANLQLFFNGQLVGAANDTAITGPGRIGIQGRIGSVDNFQATIPTTNSALTSLATGNTETTTSLLATPTMLPDVTLGSFAVTYAAVSLPVVGFANPQPSIQATQPLERPNSGDSLSEPNQAPNIIPVESRTRARLGANTSDYFGPMSAAEDVVPEEVEIKESDHSLDQLFENVGDLLAFLLTQAPNVR